jgi:Ca-activated chloride channel family protein
VNYRWLLVGVGLLALGLAAPLSGIERRPFNQPVFKSEGVTVSVHATVADASHRLVTNLDADAFTILDDDRVQPLTVFERKVLPISVLLLLDTSYSIKDSIGFVRDAAKEFVAQLRPGDRVELGAFNQRVRFVRPFTSDRQTLNRLLDLVGPDMIDYGTALWPAITEGLKEFQSVEGRKIILVLSDGENSVGTYNRFLVSRAIVADVMIYAIALQTEYRDPSRKLVKSVLDPILPRLVEETGGGYFVLDRADDLAKTFSRVAEELHHQYTLGFAAPVLDGKTHKITVAVKGDGLTVRARRSYLAARPK